MEPTDSSLTTKMTKRLPATEKEGRQGVAGTSKVGYVGAASEYIVTFNVKDVVDVNVPNLTVPEPVRTSGSK